MVIYEITAAVRADLIESYEKYMCEQHIPDLLETGFFAARAFCALVKTAIAFNTKHTTKRL